MKKAEEKEWFRLNPVLSRGAAMSFVIGSRSTGKTYAAKEWCLKDFLRNGKEFIWIRLSIAEVDAVKFNMWNDIMRDYPYDIRSRGAKIQIRPEYKEEIYIDDKGKERITDPEPWQDFGYYMSISESQKFKGGSYPKVNKVIFDEFIMENRRSSYPPDVMGSLLSLVHSGLRDKSDFRVVCLSNAGYISNPYFQYYGVKSSEFEKTDFVKRNGQGGVIFQYYRPKTNDHINPIMEKIAGEKYSNYAMHNTFMDASSDMVGPKPGGAKPIVKVTVDGEKFFTIWRSKWDPDYYVTDTPDTERGFSLDRKLVNAEYPFSSDMLSRVIKMIDTRSVLFSSQDARAGFFRMLDRS